MLDVEAGMCEAACVLIFLQCLILACFVGNNRAGMVHPAWVPAAGGCGVTAFCKPGHPGVAGGVEASSPGLFGL